MIDPERKVRTAVTKTLEAILVLTTSEKLEPFFEILFSYLKCALTHIQPQIQEDSLQILDSLLNHLPELMAQNADKLLPTVFTLISKLKESSKLGKTLTIHLGKKVSSGKWRTMVLLRLRNILEAMFKYNVKNCSERYGIYTKIALIFVKFFINTQYLQY